MKNNQEKQHQWGLLEFPMRDAPTPLKKSISPFVSAMETGEKRNFRSINHQHRRRPPDPHDSQSPGIWRPRYS